jgi:hypothetical protein
MDVLCSASQLLGERVLDLLVETHSVELERGCLAFLERRGFECAVMPNA